MPRTPGARSNEPRGRRGARRSADGTIVRQITGLVAALEALRRENQQLSEDNARLRAQLAEIGSALGRLSGAPRGRRGATTTQDAAPRRRRPITDPAALERRRAALVKARAARAEKLAAARAETATA